MNTMDTLEFLQAHKHKNNGNFLAEAQYLRDNWDWLKYSFAIAIKVKSRMEALGWTQKDLAEALHCTQQHVSNLLKGRVNMTLETLAKLEKSLQIDIIGEALTSFTNLSSVETPLYLNEPRTPEEAVSSGTSSLVDGYKPRQKKGPKKR